jgi:hypothetical protein
LCEGCHNGTRVSIHDYELNSIWKQHITPEIDYLVLNMGAWYSYYSHVLNSTTRYEEALRLVIVPTMIRLLAERPKLRIFWTDMPPFVKKYAYNAYLANLTEYLWVESGVCYDKFGNKTNCTQAEALQLWRDFYRSKRSVRAFEWHLMDEKNELAQKYLSATGAHYVNTRPALLPRKTADPMVTVDGLHWW